MAAAHARRGDLARVWDEKRLIKQIGAEIRDIDRMRHALMARLLLVDPEQRSV